MKLLSIDELKPVKGIPYSKPHLWRLIRAGKFVQPIRLGENRIAFSEGSRFFHRVQGRRARFQSGGRVKNGTPTCDETLPRRCLRTRPGKLIGLAARSSPKIIRNVQLVNSWTATATCILS